MAILRIQKKCKNFLVLEKTCLDDPKLSWKAKGLHAYLMGRPDNWKICISELQRHATDRRDSIRGAIHELIANGYITPIQIRGKDGRFGQGDYIVHEVPQGGVDGEKITVDAEWLSGESLPEDGDRCMAESTSMDQSETFKEERDFAGQEPLRFEIPQLPSSPTTSPCVDFSTTGKPALISININNNLNKTTAKGILNIPQCDFAAVDKKINNSDAFIVGNTLSPRQLDIVHGFAKVLTTQKTLVGDLPTLEDALRKALLDTRAFTQAGNDFFKKFNTLKKCIREGKWVAPIAPEKPKGKPEISLQLQHEKKHRELLQDLRHWKELLTDAMRDGKKELQASMSQIVSNCEQKIAAFLKSSNFSPGVVLQ